MSELNLVWLAAAKGLLLVIVATLYSMGGRDEFSKAVRRYGSALCLVGGTLGLSVITGSFNPWGLLSLPLFIGAYSLGYGAKDLGKKIKKRALAGAAIAVAGAPIAVTAGAYRLLVYQLIIGVLASVLLGVKSDTHAAWEEWLIGVLTVVLVPFYV